MREGIHGMCEPIRLERGRRQLFLDDHIVESCQGVRRRFHVARKDPRNPLVVPDKPWESGEIMLYGSVIREADGSWRMWYLTHSNRGEPPSDRNRVHAAAYAESQDGIHWNKPALDIMPWGDLGTNRVMGPFLHREFREFHGVIRDDNDPDPNRRYKAVFHTIAAGEDGHVAAAGRRYFTTCSPDGIHWTDVREIPVQPPVNPDIAQFVYDPVDGTYVIWARSKYASEAVRKRAPAGWFGRAVSLLTSRDFIHWRDQGVVMAPDLDDPPAMDIYSLAGFRYGDIWVGLVQAYYQFPDNHALDIQLACSRDGRNWTRLADRRPVLPLGEAGEWDRFNQSIATNPVAAGDELRIYYSGRTYRHSGYKGRDSGPHFGAIGLARWRLDGFASLDASFDGGLALTKPLVLPTSNLRLNIKADYGTAGVDVLGADGSLVAESLPISVDSVSAEVQWKNRPAEMALRDRPVRLRLRLRNARLYALWFE